MGKKSIYFLFFTLLNCYAFAQLTITSNSVANTLAQVIAGNGLTATNASLTCPNGAAGTFTATGAASALGISDGVILTTGSVTAAVGSSSTYASTSWGTTSSDPALEGVMGGSGNINDACILTFDFVPLCNTINIQFVFGSEEYPEFVGSFNDGFGIFLSGPNPGGGSYSNLNFAVLPNGTPVTINNVSPSSNSTYYNDNSIGTMSSYLAYDGYTSVITATAVVTPCQTYQMEVAIADAVDGAYDSGVLIQANSVSCTNAPAVAINSTPASCGTLGTASVTVTNYTGTPTYQWLPGGQTTAGITGLAAGNYTCLVGLNLGCGLTTFTQTTTVGSTGVSFLYNPTQTNPTCNNGTNGSASVNPSGGTAPYTYTWSTTPAQNTPGISNLAAGSYVVQVADNTGCTGSTTITLTNPAAITASVNTASTTCIASIGSATATCTGLSPYTYAWSNAATTQIINGLAAGVYSVIVTDANTCTATATGTVSTQSFSWTPTVVGTNPRCNGSSDGSATVTINNPGTSGPFGYTWSPSAQTGTVATGFSAGNYTVVITDVNGCSTFTTTTLTNPFPIAASVNTSSTICTGSVGSATATCTGLAPYTYLWSNAGTTQTITNLAAGVYSVTVTDANTCTATATGTVGAQQATWSISASGTNPLCPNSSTGTATVTVNNPGASTFTYLWMPSAQTNSVATALAQGQYIAQVTDNNNCTNTATVTLTDPPPATATVTTAPTICTGSVGSASVAFTGLSSPNYTYTWVTSPVQTTPTATALPQGSISVLVIDANGCSVVATGTVASTPISWVPVITPAPTKCFGSADGTATVTINNSSASDIYSYTWAPSGQTTNTATGFSAGNIAVTVNDQNGCVATATATITEPTKVTVTAQSSPAICLGATGFAQAFAVGGITPYTYSWTPTATLQTSQIANQLVTGNYSVVVTDFNGCIATTTVFVADTSNLKATTSVTKDICNSGIGMAVANPSGTAPYTYAWSTNPVQYTQTADSLTAGGYTVTITDANGCTTIASAIVGNKNDVLSSNLTNTPQGEILAESPTSLYIWHDTQWNLDTAFITDTANNTTVLMTQNPYTYIFPQYGTYSVTAYYTSTYGCKDTVTYNVIVKDYLTLYIPSSFTPNGDDLNEMFSAEGTFIDKFEMSIYDRWGNLIITLTDINQSWNGTKNGSIAQQDVYVYTGVVTDKYGKRKSFHGQVTLIR